MLTLAVLTGMALALTFMASKTRQILFRMGAILGWLGIGILAWTSPATIGVSTFPAGAQYVISLICVVMCIAVALMQMQTEIRREQFIKGRAGYPGAETSSWTEWGPTPRKKHMTANEASSLRQIEHKQMIHEASIRAAKRRRGY